MLRADGRLSCPDAVMGDEDVVDKDVDDSMYREGSSYTD